MSRIPPGKVLVKAGKFEGGKLPYVSYIGQIKPADMPKILWWGQYGNDTTGDGTVSNPYATFDKALEMFSSTTHKWILRTDLGVYGEPGAGPYIDNPANRVYLDPTRPDDSGDGLTPATAKKTYAAAKAALMASLRSVIHCVGSFTLSDRIDARTQGEIGETLTFAPPVNEINPPQAVQSLTAQSGVVNYGGIAQSRNVIITVQSSGSAATLLRSTDYGKTFNSIPVAITNFSCSGNKSGIATDDRGAWVLVGRTTGGATNTSIFSSLDNGVTWVRHPSINAQFRSVTWSGTHFVAIGNNRTNTNVSEIWRSSDAINWTLISSAFPQTAPWIDLCISADGDGNVAAVGYTANVGPHYQTSTDHGATWTNRSTLFPSDHTLQCIKFSGGRWAIYARIGADLSVPYRLYFSTAFTSSWTHRSGVFSGTFSSWQSAKDIVYSEWLNGWIIHKYAVSPIDRITILVTDTNITTLHVQTDPTAAITSEYLLNIRHGSETILLVGSAAGNPRGYRFDLETNIFARATNFQTSNDIAAVSAEGVAIAHASCARLSGIAVKTQTGGAITVSHIRSESGTAYIHTGDALQLRRCMVVATNTAAQITGTATTTAGIEIAQSILIGHLTLNNTNGSDKELILDNIIEGDFTAAAPVTVKSNIRGAVVNASGTAKISTINPLFVDDVDYELSRVALGQNVDSPLIKLSASYFYSYNGTIYPDDLGPHRVFAALLHTAYKRAFLLPKFSGDALNEDVENVAALIKSINGVPDVSNQPRGRLEIVSWQSKAVDSSVREFISFMERQRNTQCELYYDFDKTALDDIVVNGAHSSGTFELNIQPKDIPVGTVLTLFGQLRYVVQRYPRSGEASKLVLDDVLSGGLANGATIPIAQIQGAGTYVFVPEQRRTNRRIFSRRRDAYAGMKYTFVRKAL